MPPRLLGWQEKINREVYGRRFLVRARTEPPFSNCLNGFLVQPQSQRPGHLQVARRTNLRNYTTEKNDALEFSQTALFRAFRLGPLNGLGANDGIVRTC